MQKSIQNEYLDMLRTWAEAMKSYLFTPSDRPDLTYFGDGSGGWGVQTNQKAFAAYAVLAAMPGGEPKWLDTALALLRYSLESHIEGCYHLTGGEDVRWGHTWISVLGIERMMHGVEAIWDHLTEADRALLRKVLISEADRALTVQSLKAGLRKEDGNKPESNMWNGAIMLRVASMYPDAPNAEAYMRRGTEFIVNSISVPSSVEDLREYEGRSVAEQFVGANFFESMACNHHGYMNVGYMVITLSNAAMLHFHYRSRGLKAPKILYHNWDRLWKLVKSCIYDDGRLLRIGGDTRVRYCYCQDYLLQTLNMAADCLGEDTDSWERGWIDTLKKEMTANGDGTFLSGRAEIFVEKSPLYYTRLESDRACCISFSAWYRHMFHDFAEPVGMGDYKWDEDCKVPCAQWSDEYHGSFFVRDPGRYASFTWRSAAAKPMALCVPPSDSSLAEWQQNMTGEITGDGMYQSTTLENFDGKMLDGGFVTWGSYIAHTEGMLAEQIKEEDTLRNQIACTALPDGVTMLTLQLCTAMKNCHVSRVIGLNLNIPNDIFNDFRRTYVHRENRITVDNKLTVASIYGGELTVLRPPYRQIGLTKSEWIYYDRGFLHTDIIAMPAIERPSWFENKEIVYDIGAAVLCDGGFDGGRNMEKLEFAEYPRVRAVRVEGADRKLYTFAANFGEEDAILTLEGIGSVTVAAGAADLFA